MAKVSVIVPVFNTSRYLKKCLDTLINQTLKDIEIVVINDGSTDNSKSIVMEYLERYPNLFVFIDKINEGQAKARNIGIKKCSGEYVGFVDSDDYVDLDMFEKMYALAVHSDTDLVECNYLYIDEKSRELKQYGYVREYKNKKDMFINPLVSPWNKLYKKSILIENGIFFPEEYIYEDTSFYIKTIPFVKSVKFLNKPLVKHILHTSSTMKSNTGSKVADIFPVLEDCLNYYKKNNLYQKYEEELEYFSVKILLCSSMERIAKISDRNLKKELINKTFCVIQTNYSEYKKNKYMKKGLKNIYMRNMNRITANIFTDILRIIR